MAKTQALWKGFYISFQSLYTMKKIIFGGKTTSINKNKEDDPRIGFRGEMYDYILILITILFVFGFFLLQSA